jgi:arylsulfatase A-like enzyme
MDRLAIGGVRFAYAIVQNPVCVPSRKSMKSGHYCHTFGVMAMGKPPAVPGEYMKRARPANRIAATSITSASGITYRRLL